MLRIVLVAGARPNFMKIAPIHRALSSTPGIFRPVLVHTGQHYDENMSQVFFDELGIPEPDYFLGIGAGSHAQQTARTMIAFEEVIFKETPDWVIVVGDVNSTLACALVAVKLRVPVAHVEAGVRSFDRRMPEEINRVVTDAVSDLLLTPSEDAAVNLVREGIPSEKIHFVGNVMIDSLVRFMERARSSTILSELGIAPKTYGLATLHRPSNVDDRLTLARLLDTLETISRRLPLIFPVHPRTQRMFDTLGLMERAGTIANLHLVSPVGYLDFLCLESEARLILTDSGGVQGEATVLGVPCLTLRDSTEWPITITEGTNRLVGLDPVAILEGVEQALNGPLRASQMPKLWDGHAAERIVSVLASQPGGSMRTSQ